ncbi:MAG: YggT family protein, partial [Gammaproteobacteria bacterium]|nr:YggT family protein [Gammaproteobacteria bacterium]
GTYNPITTLLDDLTHPLLAPARRMVPPVGGLDFSPLIPIVALNLLIFLLVAPIRDLGYALL